MISFFSGNKTKKGEETLKLEEVLADQSFKALYKKNSILRNVPANLQSIHYIKGEDVIVLRQNPDVTGHTEQLVIKREGCEMSNVITGKQEKRILKKQKF